MEPLSDAELADLIRRAARSVRHLAPPELDDEDLRQIAALAFLEARHAGRPEPATEDRRHQEILARKRAVYAMLDGIRSAFRGAMSGRGRRGAERIWSLDEMEDAAVAPFGMYSPDDPQRIAELRQAVARLDRKVASPRIRECARLLAEGLDAQEVAAAMGLSPARVAQLRREARRIMRPATDIFADSRV